MAINIALSTCIDDLWKPVKMLHGKRVQQCRECNNFSRSENEDLVNSKVLIDGKVSLTIYCHVVYFEFIGWQ